jgi:type IV secretory pathway TrbL component
MKNLLIVAGLCLGTPIFAQGTMQNAGEKMDKASDATKDTANKAASDTAHATKKAASDASSATKQGTTKAANSTKTAASKADSAVQKKTVGTEPAR